ncbi:hypothetical protein BCR35DRAFT_307496 [Leucosporidium creatinivorum]|uniref:protein O-GlcNAc transferase n=1 Tax=Leucosporidium creatinivorum TaxID=106004 RepID=A0A1Y2EME0_9BASI|nr:hypothetical protein BCR35DRAFT_307496 [Leucosporidium creatinivorum]
MANPAGGPPSLEDTTMSSPPPLTAPTLPSNSTSTSSTAVGAFPGITSSAPGSLASLDLSRRRSSGAGSAAAYARRSTASPGLSGAGNPLATSSLAGFAGQDGRGGTSPRLGSTSGAFPAAAAEARDATTSGQGSVGAGGQGASTTTAVGSTSAFATGAPAPATSSSPGGQLIASSMGASTTLGRSLSTSSASRLHFPVLPASQPLPNQAFQTPTQQQAIAQKAQATSYLSSMSLPPPSPTELTGSLLADAPNGAAGHPPTPVAITSIGDHPAIPILLGQAFSPPTPGIVVSANDTSKGFQPIYASIEDWSYQAARDQVGQNKALATSTGSNGSGGGGGGGRPALPHSHSFNEREITTIAEQMARWALQEQEKQVQQQVISSKENAVILAAQVAARHAVVSAATTAVSSASQSSANGQQLPAGMSQADVQAASIVVSGGPQAGQAVENAVQDMDLSSYAESYKRQLDALASGYFAQLHREALKRIAYASETPPPSSTADDALPTTTSSLPTSRTSSPANPPLESSTLPSHTLPSLSSKTGRPKPKPCTVAGSALQDMGVQLEALLPERTGGGLKSLEVRAESIAVTTPSSGSAPPPPPPTTNAAAAPPAPTTTTTATTTTSTSPTQPAAEVAAFLTSASSSSSQSCTPEKRDYLLSYAHALYTKDASSSDLLPLLHTLEQMHEEHLPTLLLMSCVYYTRGELESSFYYNKKLLSKDPNYVEAMSNIGTTLRAMGKWRDAETWWFKAIRLRPTYWDATENLLGVLCNPSTSVSAAAAPLAMNDPPPTSPRYQEALALCEYVESQIFALDSTSSSNRPKTPSSTTFVNPISHLPRPRSLPSVVPINHVHRVQNLFYAKGNLRMALGDAAGAQDEYEKAIEVALSVPHWVKEQATGFQYPMDGLSTRDLVVVAIVLGKVLAAYAQGGSNDSEKAALVEMVRQLGVGDKTGKLAFERLFRVVKEGGDGYVSKLLAMGGGVLPTVLLQPDHLHQLPTMLFPETHGALPSLFDPTTSPATSPLTQPPHPPEIDPARKSAINSTNQTTSTMLLTLAKIFQDASGANSATRLTLGGITSSQSLLLPLYYVALALYPSPSTCNNLGILLSTMNATTLVSPGKGQAPILLSGQQLALQYYEAGLKLDPKHPHLYTNLGSLLKDMGQLPQAVAMYKKAVDFNPTFDVALANLANAVKDTGQIQESIPFYRRAVMLNPQFPEAICGLVNALGGVCDWQGRGGVGEEYVVDNNNVLVPTSSIVHVVPGVAAKTGYMGQINDLVDKQLRDGLAYGIGSMRSLGTLEEWLAIITQAIYDQPPAAVGDAAQAWIARLQFILSDISEQERKDYCINEGGFLIRLVERLTRRIQRRWYLSVFGTRVESMSIPPARIVPTSNDLVTYRRPPLPPSLPPIAVPTVLPFHCFTLSASARETRLISHRTGLRISHSTLNQPWLPPIVYPPPRPPLAGKLNIGYVSSDLGNHPLSHLMQSVFGFHDSSKYNVFVYATSPSDKSPYRQKIEAEAQHFVDVSAASTQQIVDRVVHDEIHILINLSGYTKGARNEVFAARPAPVQMSYMGFAGTLSAGWCDYFIVDPIVCPPALVSGNQWRFTTGLSGGNRPDQIQGADKPTDFEGDPDPEAAREDFVYTEKLMYMPHSYFVTDHKQAWREDPTVGLAPDEVPIRDDGTPGRAWAIEEDKRWKMRKQIFPNIRDDTVIFANWNQLYKIDPFIFRIWLNILIKIPNSILWLLRFPAPGEAHLKETALRWAGQEVADRVVFTDVANKNDHIHRGRVADLFLDTTEMASRVAASIAVATGHGKEMIVSSGAEYEHRALFLASGLHQPDAPEARVQRRGKGELSKLRRKLFLSREQSPLFDTRRWVQNMEKGLTEAWKRWVQGTEFEVGMGVEKQTGCIWVADARDSTNVAARKDFLG